MTRRMSPNQYLAMLEIYRPGEIGYNKAMTTIDIPEEIDRDEAKLFLAMKLFEKGKMSLGQASLYAGFSKRAFVELLGKHKIPVIDYPVEEIELDIKNA